MERSGNRPGITKREVAWLRIEWVIIQRVVERRAIYTQSFHQRTYACPAYLRCGDALGYKRPKCSRRDSIHDWHHSEIDLLGQISLPIRKIDCQTVRSFGHATCLLGIFTVSEIWFCLRILPSIKPNLWFLIAADFKLRYIWSIEIYITR